MSDTTLNDDSQGAVEQGKEQVQEKASQLGDQVQQTARDQIDQRSTDAGERVQALSSDLRSVGERLREDGKEGPANLADQVADRADRLGGYLSASDASTILEDVEDFGRRWPLVFMAAAAGVGFVAGRFLMASAARSADAAKGVGDAGLPSNSRPTATLPGNTGSVTGGVSNNARSGYGAAASRENG